MLNEKRENRFAYLVNAPMMVYLCCVLVFPMIWGLYMSFTIRPSEIRQNLLGSATISSCWEIRSTEGRS